MDFILFLYFFHTFLYFFILCTGSVILFAKKYTVPLVFYTFCKKVYSSFGFLYFSQKSIQFLWFFILFAKKYTVPFVFYTFCKKVYSSFGFLYFLQKKYSSFHFLHFLNEEELSNAFSD